MRLPGVPWQKSTGCPSGSPSSRMPTERPLARRTISPTAESAATGPVRAASRTADPFRAVVVPLLISPPRVWSSPLFGSDHGGGSAGGAFPCRAGSAEAGPHPVDDEVEGFPPALRQIVLGAADLRVGPIRSGGRFVDAPGLMQADLGVGGGVD